MIGHAQSQYRGACAAQKHK